MDDYNLVIIGLSILFSAIFSGMEIAFLSSNKLRIELDRKQGTFTSRIVQIYTKNPNRYIATMLVGNNIALVIYGLAMAVMLESFLEPYISNEMGMLLVQTIFSTAIILVTAEFLPKSIFRMHPNGFLNFFALPMLFFYIIFYPISRFSTSLSFGIIRRIFRFEVSQSEENKVFEKVDLNHFVGEAQSIEREESEQEHDIKMFQNALDFSEVKVRDCMLPRTDIEAIDSQGTIAELTEKFIKTNYSRIPVYEGSIDNIIGYVNSKDMFKRPQSIKSKMFKIDFVPETMQAHELLTTFIREQKSLAIVVDEFGGTAGLVTIEDVIEEIFGEIDDEHDSSEFVEKQLSYDEFILSGRLEIDYLNDKYDFHIPESEEYDTLAGFIISNYQSIPKPQEEIEIDSFRLRVVKMDGTRIDQIHFTINSKR